MNRVYFAPSRKKAIQHRYCKRINQRLENHTFWGIRLEVLFRGFSPAEMFQIEAELRDLISRRKTQALNSAQLKEVSLEALITKPFKDEVV